MTSFENLMKKSATQSNPVFGKSGLPYYRTDNRDMAMKGFVTPNQLVCYSYFDENGNDLVEFKGSETDDAAFKLVNMKQFIECLMQIADKHHARIRRDSMDRRSGFLFVTVPGNKYLKEIRNSPELLAWANERKAGIYMTSSPVNDKRGDYEAGGQIKYCDDKNWYPDRIVIGDFIDIINDKVPDKIKNDDYRRIALTKDVVRNHINIIVNIDQLNAGVNLPGLNGVFAARYLNKNNPLTKQIPGRASRPDPEDIPAVGNGHSEYCPCLDSGRREDGTYWYVKPYSYIYICPNMFDPEQRAELEDLFNSFYADYAMKKIIMDDNMKGLPDEDEGPDNSNRENDEGGDADEVYKEVLPKGNESVYDLLRGYIANEISVVKNAIQKIYFGCDQSVFGKVWKIFNAADENSRKSLSETLVELRKITGEYGGAAGGLNGEGSLL